MKNTIIAMVILALVGGVVGFYIHKKHKDKLAKQAGRVKKPKPGEESKADGKPGDESTADATPFKVALVTPGPQNDGGWNQNAAGALKRIETELAAETLNSAKSGEDAHTRFRQYADNKFRVVIGHGSEFNDQKTAEIAAEYPDTIFLISGSDKSDKNVVGVRFVLEDGTFVLGQLAALMSKTDKLGCIGPEHLPVIESTFDAFEQGAKSVKPDIKVIQKWTESSSNIAEASEKTKFLIGEGVDFIFQNANDGAKGVFQAVQQNNKDKRSNAVFVLGSNDDQAVTMPEFSDVILASATLDIGGTYVGICTKIKNKTFERTTQFVGIAEGAVTVALNKKFEETIPADVRKKIEETIEKLKKGEKLYKRKELK